MVTATENHTSEEVRIPNRQRQILQLLAKGYDDASVAQQLGIAHETVRTHLKRCVSKLGAKNRTHAVAIALRAGVIS